MLNFSKISLAAALVAASLVVACGSDDGKTTDSTGTSSSSGSSGKPGTKPGTSSSSGDQSSSTETEQTQTCEGSSLCINGVCKCDSGPKKGVSCCNPPESEDDPPCAKANVCDTVCNSCN